MKKGESSIFKYVLANPEFSLKDKIQFLGFYPLTIASVLFLIWIGYKGIREHLRPSALDLLILLLLFAPLLKYQKSVVRKFFIPYKKLIGQPQEAEKLERGISYRKEFLKTTGKTFFKFYIIEALAAVAVLILFIGVFVVSKDIHQYEKLLPFFIAGMIASFIVFSYCFFKTLKRYTKETTKLSKKYKMYKKWQGSFNEVLLWSTIIIAITVFLVVTFFLLVE